MKSLLKTIFKRLLMVLTITIEILYAFIIGWWMTLLISLLIAISLLFKNKYLYYKFTSTKDEYDLPLLVNILYGWFIMKFFVKLFKLDTFIE